MLVECIVSVAGIGVAAVEQLEDMVDMAKTVDALSGDASVHSRTRVH